MSKETRELLNGGNILVGGGFKPWWLDESLIAALIASGQMERSPLYDGPVPIEAAHALFSEVITGYKAAALKPLEGEAMLFFPDGSPFPYRVVISEDHQLVGPEGRDVFFECFRSGYDTANHQFADVLIDATSAIVGDGVELQTVGRLRDGAVAFVTVGVPETFKTPEGVEFRPNLTAGSSFNGKIATQWGRHYGLTVCDNTMELNLSEAQKSGQLVKVKHTAHSVLRIANAREALGLIETGAETFAAEIAALCATPVSSTEWESILNELVPLPLDESGKVNEKGRGFTMASSKRESLNGLLHSDDRVEPWAGTAFGVLQAFNTWNAHEGIIRGNVHRAERQYENKLTHKTADQDRETLAAIAKVTERKLELVPA